MNVTFEAEVWHINSFENEDGIFTWEKVKTIPLELAPEQFANIDSVLDEVFRLEQDTGQRSMMVADRVVIGETAFQCMMVGWKRVEHPSLCSINFKGFLEILSESLGG